MTEHPPVLGLHVGVPVGWFQPLFRNSVFYRWVLLVSYGGFPLGDLFSTACKILNS